MGVKHRPGPAGRRGGQRFRRAGESPLPRSRSQEDELVRVLQAGFAPREDAPRGRDCPVGGVLGWPGPMRRRRTTVHPGPKWQGVSAERHVAPGLRLRATRIRAWLRQVIGLGDPGNRGTTRQWYLGGPAAAVVGHSRLWWPRRVTVGTDLALDLGPRDVDPRAWSTAGPAHSPCRSSAPVRLQGHWWRYPRWPAAAMAPGLGPSRVCRTYPAGPYAHQGSGPCMRARHVCWEWMG